MSTVSVSLGTLVDRALFMLQGPESTPALTTLLADITAGATTLTLTADTAVNITDIIEIGAEQLLVTGKTADAIPVFTVSRGYYGTTAVAHTTTEAVLINPRYARKRVAEAIRWSFTRLEALGLPLIDSDTFNRIVGEKAIAMPSETRDVLRVAYIATDGRWVDLDAWEFIDNVPTAKYPTGKILRIPRYISDDDDIEIIFRVPYRWSTYPVDPSEASTITMHEGSEDLPALYAVARLLASREIGRTEIDRAEEWNVGEPSRGGVSGATVRQAWQEFYRALDEARRLVPGVPLHRPYIKRPRLTR